MNILISKNQALEIARALVTGEKERNDYGSSALKEAGVIIGDMLRLDKIEEELLTAREERDKSSITIADLEEEEVPLGVADLEKFKKI